MYGNRMSRPAFLRFNINKIPKAGQIPDRKMSIDLWLSMSIEGKRKDLLEHQMELQLKKMRIHKFNYHE